MEGFSRRSFRARMRNGHEAEHDVYERGEGPAVVLIQELPGIGQETLRLAEALIAAGYRVVLPHLFGPLGRTAIPGNLVRVLCLRREFRVFAKSESSPIVDWLRALCRDVKNGANARGVGVIGMCLTGNFAITLMGDDAVLAAVAAQPSLGRTPSGLHMSETEVQATCARIDALGLGPMLAFRFEGDRMCPPEKFVALDAVFNRDARRVDLRTLPGAGHAVLTRDFLDRQGRPRSDALERVIAYFDRCLKPT
jgi:dienelactone hydrolase